MGTKKNDLCKVEENLRIFVLFYLYNYLNACDYLLVDCMGELCKAKLYNGGTRHYMKQTMYFISKSIDSVRKRLIPKESDEAALKYADAFFDNMKPLVDKYISSLEDAIRVYEGDKIRPISYLLCAKEIMDMTQMNINLQIEQNWRQYHYDAKPYLSSFSINRCISNFRDLFKQVCRVNQQLITHPIDTEETRHAQNELKRFLYNDDNYTNILKEI